MPRVLGGARRKRAPARNGRAEAIDHIVGPDYPPRRAGIAHGSRPAADRLGDQDRLISVRGRACASAALRPGISAGPCATSLPAGQSPRRPAAKLPGEVAPAADAPAAIAAASARRQIVRRPIMAPGARGSGQNSSRILCHRAQSGRTAGRTGCTRWPGRSSGPGRPRRAARSSGKCSCGLRR